LENSLVSQGAELMVFGMGTVIIFLALLVVATTGMSKVVTRFFPVAEPVVPPKKNLPPAAADKQTLVAVITAAIHQHRQAKKPRQ